MAKSREAKTRRLVLVLGDQLDADSPALAGLDPDRDAVLMMEVEHEARYVPQHKLRLVLFFSAMRHFRDTLRERGLRVHYSELDDPANRGRLGDELARRAKTLRPERLSLVEPGDHRVERELRRAARGLGLSLDVVTDRHFLCDDDEFEAFAEGRKTLRLEHFYRRMRRRHEILLDEDQGPAGGRWNFDDENRETFGREGPDRIKAPRSFRPDPTTRAVAKRVAARFPESPGSVERFDLPVTHAQARAALRDFVEHRLEGFGPYQDAMAAGRPFLYHSRLSTSLNLHLLDPRDAIRAAVDAYRAGSAPLRSVEGFVRQILGWREFIRGVYRRYMPAYADENALGADLPMPAFFWTADTGMRCVRESVSQLVDHAYAHHIQRLMVLGQFALLLGVRPYDVHRWHISMYADAVDWVSLPNVLGMSQYADGGLVATKPYCATGAYIDRMSDYCRGCRYDPGKATGDGACPFTTLYWDFLSRNRRRLSGNRRMALQLKNLDRKPRAERRAIRSRAAQVKQEATEKTWL